MMIEKIDIWHQQWTLADVDVTKDSTMVAYVTIKEEEEEEAAITTKGLSSLQTTIGPLKEFRKFFKAEKESTLQVTDMERLFILKIFYTALPLSLFRNMASMAIDKNQSELLALLNEQNALNAKIKLMDGIELNSDDKVAPLQLIFPITYDEFLLNQAAIAKEDNFMQESRRGNRIYCYLLMVVCITYLFKMKSQMVEVKGMTTKGRKVQSSEGGYQQRGEIKND